jgi:tRNA(fMet)-specific endonuclease VapC
VTVHVLDTDTLSLYQHGHPVVCQNVQSRPAQSLATTVITVQEQISGWYHLLNRASRRDQVADLYDRLKRQIELLTGWNLLPFPVPAIIRFESLLGLKLNIGKMDLRIAAITLEIGGTVVTRNLRDFQRVPGLTIEDWSV